MRFFNIVKLGALTFLSRIFGLLRDILISRYLGVSLYSDLFFIAFKLPNLFRRLFAEGSMQAVFVPIFVSVLAISKEEALLFARSVFTYLVIGLCLLVLMLMIFAPQVLLVIAPGLQHKKIQEFGLAVLLIRITLPYLFFISIASLFSSILNSIDKFFAVGFMPVLLNICMIIFLLMGDVFPNYAIAASIGVIVGGILQLLFVILFCYKYGWGLSLVNIFNSHSIYLKKFFKNFIPVLLSSGVYQINIIIELILSSFLSFGTLSYLFYADRIYQLPLAIIGISISTVMLPYLSKTSKDMEKNQRLNEIFLLSLSLTFFVTVFVLFFSKQIISFVYLGGKFSVKDVDITSDILMIMIASLALNVSNKLILAVYYAKGNTKQPFYATLFGLVINFGLIFIFFSNLTIYKIVIIGVISAVLNFIFLYGYAFYKKYFVLGSDFFTELKKILYCLLIISVVLFIWKLCIGYYFQKLLFNLWLLRFLLVFTILVSCVLYFILLKLMKLKAVIMLIRLRK